MRRDVRVHFVEIVEQNPADVVAVLCVRAHEQTARLFELSLVLDQNENEIRVFWPRADVSKEVRIHRYGIQDNHRVLGFEFGLMNDGRLKHIVHRNSLCGSQEPLVCNDFVFFIGFLVWVYVGCSEEGRVQGRKVRKSF